VADDLQQLLHQVLKHPQGRAALVDFLQTPPMQQVLKEVRAAQRAEELARATVDAMREGRRPPRMRGTGPGGEPILVHPDDVDALIEACVPIFPKGYEP